MAANYRISAGVVDIRSDAPLGSDVFLVDTNVWYWLAYTKASQTSQPSQAQHYPTYISSALQSGATLRRCELSLAELAHTIEKTERELFIQASGLASLQTKEFRHNYPTSRNTVVAEVNAAWNLVKSMSSPIGITLSETCADSALIRMASQLVDGYDLFILEALSNHGIIQLITDDGDFGTVPNLTIFTANHRIIEAARVQGKLVVRQLANPPSPPP